MAEETTYYELAQPEEGAKNSGIAINGDLDIIDLELMKRENLVLSNNVFVKSGSDMVYHNLGV